MNDTVNSPEIDSTSDSKIKRRNSFSFFFFTWLILTLYLGGFLYYLAFMDPFQNRNFTPAQNLILQLLFSSPSQIFIFLLLFEILPFSPIDFSFTAMKKSIFHKLLFIFTSPIFIIEIITLNYLLNPVFTNESVTITFLLIISILPIIIWIIITLWIWEVFNGKNSSQFLSNIRNNNEIRNSDAFIISLSNQPLKNVTGLDYQRRWLVIVLIIPLLIFNISEFFNNSFFAWSLYYISFNLFLFHLVFPQYLFSLKKKGYNCSSIIAIYNKVFGYFDISKNITLYGVLLVFLLFIVESLNHNNMIDLRVSYILEVLIFIFILFSNQLKRFLGMKEKMYFEDDNYDDNYISLDDIKW